MASVSVQKGISSALRLPSDAVFVVGKQKHLKAVAFENLEQKFDGVVSKEHWRNAVEKLPASGSLPLYLDVAKIISVPDTPSRHNTPSSSLAISKELRAASVPSYISALSIVLVCEYEHSLASVSAIAQSFPLYSRKTTPPTLQFVQIEIVFTDKQDVSDADISYLSSVATLIQNVCRLVDAPANELTTTAFVAEAVDVAHRLGVQHTVIQGEDLREKGFGAIYHVGKAALEPPAFVVLSHTPPGATSTYAMVGKGIVFDTGGMQIKTKKMMPSMKRDMAGAAGILGAFEALVKAHFNQNLHCLLCIAENSISPKATKPDDIIKLLSGKTCEVNNTDAEGRLVLADGIFYAKETLKADVIMDMATLTGAQWFMTGKLHGALLTNSQKWEEFGPVAGRFSGDLLHTMVFTPDLHSVDLASDVADMKNAFLGKMTGPPAAFAGLFVGAQIEFGEGLEWLHIDMVMPAECGERGTGYGVALVSVLFGEHTDVPLLKATNNFSG